MQFGQTKKFNFQDHFCREAQRKLSSQQLKKYGNKVLWLFPKPCDRVFHGIAFIKKELKLTENIDKSSLS